MFRGILSTIYVDLKSGHSIKKIVFIKTILQKYRFVKILKYSSNKH